MSVEKVNLTERLNYYSQNHDFKDSKKWAIEWLKEKNLAEALRLKDVKEHRFSNRGFVCKILDDGYDLGEKIKSDLLDFFMKIDTTKVPENEEQKESEKLDIPIHRINPIISKVEDAIDAILSDKDHSVIYEPFSTRHKKDYNEAEEWIENQIVEVGELMQKYAAICKLLEETKDRCDKLSNLEKRYEETPSRFDKRKEIKKAVETIKYMKFDPTSGITSISPAKIVGAKGLIAYDTRYNMVVVFIANEGGLRTSGLSVKNFDPKKSFMVTGKKFCDFVKSKKDVWTDYNWELRKKYPACSRLGERFLLISVK